jgi:hypothetical protein
MIKFIVAKQDFNQQKAPVLVAPGLTKHHVALFGFHWSYYLNLIMYGLYGAHVSLNY